MYAGVAVLPLQRTTTDRLVVEAGDHEQPGRRPHLGDIRVQAEGGIEPGVEALVELGEVRPQARLSLVAGRVDDVDAHERGSEEAVNAGHRLHEHVALRW